MGSVWWTWSGSNATRPLGTRKLLILRKPRSSKMPTIPNRLYDFCTVHFELFLLRTHLSHTQTNEKIPQVIPIGTESLSLGIYTGHKSSPTQYRRPWR